MPLSRAFLSEATFSECGSYTRRKTLMAMNKSKLLSLNVGHTSVHLLSLFSLVQEFCSIEIINSHAAKTFFFLSL